MQVTLSLVLMRSPNAHALFIVFIMYVLFVTSCQINQFQFSSVKFSSEIHNTRNIQDVIYISDNIPTS